MLSERLRAEEMGYQSPICRTLEETHHSYNEGMKTTMERVVVPDHGALLIASHNEESIQRGVSLIQDHGLAANDPRVYFGQLYAMCDHMSYGLAQEGYNIVKYVPFGPVRAVIPYLMRRMQENKGVIGRTEDERELYLAAIEQRLTSWLPF